ncbi:unnamed protein product [Cunninghamella blakesleeana]
MVTINETSPLLSKKTSMMKSSICSHMHLLQNNQKEASATKKKLMFACTLAFLFFITEVTAGYLANSLALLSDGFHLLSDVASFIVAIIAIYLAEKPPTKRHSYGFHRAEVIAAIISVFTIWILTGFLVTEAFHRISHPQKIDAKVMCVTASIGVLINIILAYVLGGHHHHHHHDEDEEDTIDHLSVDERSSKKAMKNINLQAAALHVLGDLLASLGVLISSIILWIKPEYSFVDPLCTFLFSMIVMYTTFHLMRDSMIILMEGVPLHIDLQEIETTLLYHFKSSIHSIHDLHVWTLSPGKVALTCHLVVLPSSTSSTSSSSSLSLSLPPSPSSSSSSTSMTSTSITISGNVPKKTSNIDLNENELLLQVQTLLSNHFHIVHSTLQIEKVPSTSLNHIIHNENDDCYITCSL